MDMRLFEKTPQVAPLLVRLYDSHKLYALAQDETPLARAELTGAIVELLEMEIGPRERELIADVLISLMRQAEIDLRQAISERLAAVDATPLRVALHIANDEIEVASPMLRLSRVFSDLDLLYIIKSRGPEYWRAIAAREKISNGVMNVLADTRDDGTLETLATNTSVTPTMHTLGVMEECAAQSESVARSLLMRPGIPEGVARRLYARVGAELKAYIRDYYGVHDDATQSAIDDVVFEMSEDVREFVPRESAIKAADALAASGRLNMQRMVETLQRGQIASFVAMFARYTGLGTDRVHEMLSEPGGTTLAVACRATGLTKSDLSRVYMMTQRLRSKDRIVDQAELLHTLAVYDRIKMDEARRMLGL